MRALLLLSTGVLLSACASNQVAMVETGYEPGALGLAAIERHDWQKAEALLNEQRGVGEANPARLINLGTVYWRSGREAEARATWKRALAAERHFMVADGTGRMVSTDAMARLALARHGGD